MSFGRKLCLMSWNSRGLRSKIKDIKSNIEKQKCHVVFLQETYSVNSKVLEILKDWKTFYTKAPTLNKRGVAILIRKSVFEESGCTENIDPSGCYIVVKCTLKGQLFTLVSVYNSQKDTNPLMRLINVLENYAEGILLIGGDFNVPLNPYLDRNSTTTNKIHSCLQPVVKRFMTAFHLVDVWRRFHPIVWQQSYQQNNVMSRLDYLFVPEESMQYIKTCEISKEKSHSDHYPILFDINISKEENKKPEFRPNISEEETTINICTFMKLVLVKWLNCKQKLDFTINPHKPLIISALEIGRVIQSFAVNQINAERQDGIPLSFYKSNLHALMSHLCAFYHNVFERSMIPESFSEALRVSETHYIFNVDYLILATVMARWLDDHLESHSADYNNYDKNHKSVLFAFKKQSIEVSWTVLKSFLEKEKDRDQTDPPLLDTFKTDILDKILTKSPSSECRLLRWGCPLTLPLMALYLKHVANEMVDNVKDQTPNIFYISRENVIARFSADLESNALKYLGDTYKMVDCIPVNEIISKNSQERSGCE